MARDLVVEVIDVFERSFAQIEQRNVGGRSDFQRAAISEYRKRT